MTIRGLLYSDKDIDAKTVVTIFDKKGSVIYVGSIKDIHECYRSYAVLKYYGGQYKDGFYERFYIKATKPINDIYLAMLTVYDAIVYNYDLADTQQTEVKIIDENSMELATFNRFDIPKSFLKCIVKYFYGREMTDLGFKKITIMVIGEVKYCDKID